MRVEDERRVPFDDLREACLFIMRPTARRICLNQTDGGKNLAVVDNRREINRACAESFDEHAQRSVASGTTTAHARVFDEDWTLLAVHGLLGLRDGRVDFERRPVIVRRPGA